MRGISQCKKTKIRNQLGSGQRKDTRKPQIEQSTNKDIEQNRENIPKHVYNPQEIKSSNIPKSNKPNLHQNHQIK